MLPKSETLGLGGSPVEISERAGNWTVAFIRPEGEDPYLARGGFHTRGDAEYFGRCLWASPGGRGVTEVRVRRLPEGAWLAVTPGSVCGGVRR